MSPATIQRSIVSLLSLLILMTFYTNCDVLKNFPKKKMTTRRHPSSEQRGEEKKEERREEPMDPKDIPLMPFGRGQRVENCLKTTTEFANACIFEKNPIAHQGRPLHPQEIPLVNAGAILNDKSQTLIGINDVSNIQTYAVRIPGDQLKSQFFSVDYSKVGSSEEPLKKNLHDDWKYAFHNDINMSLVDIHAFFWLNHLSKRVQKLTGQWHPKDKSISVLPFVAFSKKSEKISIFSNAFWVKSRNFMAFGLSKALGTDDQGGSTYIPLGLDASIVLHEAGHAILDHSTSSSLSSGNLDRKCGTSMCSRSINGSPRAIHEGVGDIMSILIFPDFTAIGEVFYNNTQGFRSCEAPRSAKEIKKQKITAQDLFNACSPKKGEIHAMGAIYSTIWYGVFQKALQRGGKEEREIAYQLFFEHLKNITSNDTFITLKKSIKVIDQNLFKGHFSGFLDEEYKLLNL